MQDQGYYYFEYAVPELNNKEDFENTEINFDNISVVDGEVFYAMNEHNAHKVATEDIVSDRYPAYDEYDFGFVMITRVCDADKTFEEAEEIVQEEIGEFTEEDWQERLERVNPDGKTIEISEEEFEDLRRD